MTCTFFDCDETPTREVTWMGKANGVIVVGPVTHPYCEAHAQGMHGRASLTIIDERVLEVVR